MALKQKKIIGADIGVSSLQMVNANGRNKITNHLLNKNNYQQNLQDQ